MADIKELVDDRHQGRTAKELADESIHVIRGVSEGDVELIEQAFGIKTVREFANLSFVQSAQNIVALAEGTPGEERIAALEEQIEHAIDLISSLTERTSRVLFPVGTPTLFQPGFGFAGWGQEVATGVEEWQEIELTPCEPTQIGWGNSYWDMDVENKKTIPGTPPKNDDREVTVKIGDNDSDVPARDSPPSRVRNRGNGVSLHLKKANDEDTEKKKVRYRWRTY